MNSRIILTLFCLTFLIPQLYSQCTQPLNDFWVPESAGSIQTVEPTPSGDTVFVGGGFQSLARYTGNLCRVGKQAAGGVNMPVVDGEIHDIISDGDGGWYIGGQFQHVGGFSRVNVARIDKNGNVHPFTANANGIVRSLHLMGDKVFIGGQFTHINLVQRNYLAAMDTSGTLLGWHPDLNNIVYKVGSKNGQLLVGGFFTSVNGFARGYLAQVDTATALPTTWSASLNSGVTEFVLDDSLIYLLGQFTTVGATTRNYVAAVRWSNGSLYTPISVSQNGSVADIEVLGGTLYLGGSFSTLNAGTRPGFAALNKITGTLNTLSHNFSGSVTMVKAADNDLFVSGYFTQVNNDKTRRYIARLNGTTGAIKNWDPLLTSSVNCITASDTTIVMGGLFQGYNRVARLNLAAFRISTNELLSWSPVLPLASNVNKIHYLDNKVIIGGTFDSLNGTYRRNIAMADLNGQVTGWDPSPNSAVYDITSAKGVVYISGDFTMVGGLTRKSVAAVNASLGNVTAFAIDPSIGVSYIETYGDRLYMTGRFTSISGASKQLFAAYDLSANPQNPSPVSGGPVFGLSSSNLPTYLEAGYGRVFVGFREYTSFFNYTINGYSLDTQSLTPLKMFGYTNADLGGLALTDSTAIVSLLSGGNMRLMKIAFDGLTSVDLTPTSIVTELKKAGDRLFIYGVNLTSIGGSEFNQIGSLSLSNRVQFSASRSYTNLCGGDSITFTSSASSGNLWNDFSSAQTRTIAPLGVTTYNIYVKAPVIGCSMSVSNFVRFTVNTNPSLNLTSNKNNYICPGDSSVFRVSTSALNTILWSNGSTADTISVYGPGTHSVTVTDAKGCKATASRTQNYHPVPPKPQITPSGEIHVCNDSVVTLTSSATSGNMWLHGLPYNSVQIAVTGSYSVYYTDSVGCVSDTSDPVNVYIDTFPLKPEIFASKTGLCGANDSLILSVTNVPGDSLRWSTGESGGSIVIHSTGKYAVTSRNGPCSMLSDTSSFESIKPARPLVTPTKNPPVLCQGDSMILSSNFLGASVWSNHQQVKNLRVKQAGTYRVVSVVEGCISDSSEPVTVVVNPVPPTPVLTQDGDSIWSNADSANSWYRNNLFQPALQGRYIIPSTSGDYSVIVTNSFGCKSARSNVIKYLKTGLVETSIGSLRLYPNPASGIVYLEPDQAMYGKHVVIEVTDMLGRQLVSERFIVGQTAMHISTDVLPGGYYQVLMRTDEGELYRQSLVVNK